LEISHNDLIAVNDATHLGRGNAMVKNLKSEMGIVTPRESAPKPGKA